MKNIGTIFGYIIMFLIGWGIVSALANTVFGGEVEGSVKYDDCRQIISIKEGSSDTYFKKFTCDDFKSNSGRLISGTCVHLEMNGGTCVTAYVYDKKSDFNCGSNSTPNIDDSKYACSCNDGYHVDPKDNTKCLIGYPTDTPMPTIAQ